MNTPDNASPIRIGLMPPLTGLVELYGPEISHAGRIACAEVNAAGGVLGRPLELVIRDDGSLPETAVPAAEALLDEDGCVALIGNLLSNSRIAVADRVADPRQVPFLNFSFYEGSIRSRWFFHFAALPNQQIDRMIPAMVRRYGPKMFFAGSNYEWPRGSIDAAKRALAAAGGECVGEEYLPIGAPDMCPLLEMVARSGADVFVPYFAGADQVQLLTGFTKRGLKPRMAVVMGHYDEAMVGLLPPEVREGFYSSNTYFMSLETPENRAYLERLAALPGVSGIWPAGDGVLTNFGEGAYLCVHAFAAAANRAGSLDPEALQQALETTRVRGPQGEVEMDPVTHHAVVNTYLARCRADGAFEIVERFGHIRPVIPERYRSMAEGPPQGDGATVAPAAMPPTLGVGLALIEPDLRIGHASAIFAQSLGYANPAELAGREAAVLWHDPDEFALVLGIIRDQGEWIGQTSLRTQGGDAKTLEITLERIGPAKETRGYALSCVEPSLARGPLETLRRILSVTDIAVIATDEQGRIIQVNRRSAELFGYPEGEMIGLPVHLLLPPQYRDAHAGSLAHFVLQKEPDIRMGHRGEIVGYRKDGSQFPAEASLSKFQGPDGWVLVATLHDITTRKQMEERLTWKATHDPLTGLPNRILMRDRLDHALDRSRRYGQTVALLFVDLDHFKLINDTHGHDAGDQLLTEVGNRLVESVRPGDTVARFGGDEFVILCENLREASDLTALPERILTRLREPIHIGHGQVFTSASIGLAEGSGGDHSAEELMRNADAAMYQAKEQGRDGWRFFNAELHADARRRLTIGNGLRTAIAQDEFQVRLQPIVSTLDGAILGVELLLRWFPPEGEIPPDIFIPVAESNGTIPAIGEWVFRRACEIETRLRRQFGARAPYLSVNVSTRQLNVVDLVTRCSSILDETAADPDRILIEITETALMTDAEANLRALNRLADLGLRVAVDDFGTGYSSLAQLLRMPVSTVKIDRIFVSGLDTRKDSRAIVAAVLRMAEALQLKTVAEGVETATELEWLRRLGCEAVQGFLYHRPMTEAALFELLEGRLKE